MSKHPTVTAEELACLLPAPSLAEQIGQADRWERLLAQSGAGLWLLKGLLVYVALQTLGLNTLPAHYVWLRCALEVMCCAVFWSTLHQAEHRNITLGALLVGWTTLCMDMLMVLALPA
ncbi:MAG: hypothetical protein FJY36_03035 [Betaproteobacteria bacterium]|nr:hypothetical protein [Betaproteobacteria bacterium]